jgi:hypothetical protein
MTAKNTEATTKTAARKAAAKTREQWLEQAVRMMDRQILRPAGYMMPEHWKISVSFAKTSGGHRAIGQCWPPERAADGKTTHILVCPTMDASDPVRVLDIVLHEMGHAAVGCEHAHKKAFRDFVKAVGLDGKVTATYATPGSELHVRLGDMAARLGAYPHPALKPVEKVKPAGGGWVRYESVGIPGYKVVVSPKMVDEHGAPRDPEGDEMVLDGTADELRAMLDGDEALAA